MELSPAVKQELVGRLQKYLAAELDMELGAFDAEFLLDFFSREIGFQFYNQGLADAFKAFEGKMEEFGELLFELEAPGPD